MKLTIPIVFVCVYIWKDMYNLCENHSFIQKKFFFLVFIYWPTSLLFYVNRYSLVVYYDDDDHYDDGTCHSFIHTKRVSSTHFSLSLSFLYYFFFTISHRKYLRTKKKFFASGLFSISFSRLLSLLLLL